MTLDREIAELQQAVADLQQRAVEEKTLLHHVMRLATGVEESLLELKTEMASLRSELAQIRHEAHTEAGRVRADIHAAKMDVLNTRTELQEWRLEFPDLFSKALRLALKNGRN